MTSSSREIILTSSPEGPIIAYDALSGATLAHFTGSRSPRKGLTLAGKSLIAASHISSDATCGFIHLYNWWSSAAFHHLPVPEPVAPITATLDGLYLFSGGLSGKIHTLSLPSGHNLRSFPAHSKPVSCLTINDDGSLLVSGGDDGNIVVFPVLRLLDVSIYGDDKDDDDAYFMLYSFEAHESSVTSISIGMGGCNATMISCSLDCTCKFWILTNGTHLRTVRFPCMIWGVVVDATESEFYAGGSDGRIYVGVLKVGCRRRDGGAELVTWWGMELHEGAAAVTALALINEGRNLVLASEDGRIQVWEVERGEMIRVLEHERDGICDMVVAKGITNGVGIGMECSITSGSVGFCGREIRKPMKELNEMEEVLSEVVKERRRAIDRLEMAIGTYQRLLELILKEAQAGGSNKNDNRSSKERGGEEKQ